MSLDFDFKCGEDLDLNHADILTWVWSNWWTLDSIWRTLSLDFDFNVAKIWTSIKGTFWT